MSSSSGAPSAPVKRACDSCHRRKVKCIGEGTNPCKNCVSAGLTCTYNAIPQKKGPKGSRAKVLSELRETQQRQSQFATGFPTNDFRFDQQASFSPTSRAPGLLTPEVANGYVDFFFTHLYSSQPILHRQRTQEAVLNMDSSIEAYCFVVALCASVLIQSNMNLPTNTQLHGEGGPASNIAYGNMLLEEAVQTRRASRYIEEPTTTSIATSFFLYSCYYALDKQNLAWFYLREATTHIHLTGMHDEESYKGPDLIENSRKRRLFWLVFITERIYAIHKYRPITLSATIKQPSQNDDPTDPFQLTGFIHLINLYRPFDNTFIGLWSKMYTATLPNFLANLQAHLSEALPAYLNTTEIQAVDLRTSQQWLRTMVWKLSVSHPYLASVAHENALDFKYPVEITRDVLAMSPAFTQQTLDVCGIGLIEKLFDIAVTLTDIIAHIPVQQQYQSQQQYPLATASEYLSSLVSLLSGFRAAQPRFLPMLLTKIAQNLPNASIVLPQTHPTPPLPRQALPNPPGSMFDDDPPDHTAATGTSSSDATPFGSPPPIPSSMSVPPGHELSYTNFKPQTHVHDGMASYPFASGMVFQTHVGHPGQQPGNEPAGGRGGNGAGGVGGSGMFGSGMDHRE